MLSRIWSSWWRRRQSVKRMSAWQNWGPISNIEQLELRTLLSAINGVDIASRFTIDPTKPARTNMAFKLTGLAADSDGDGNVNGRTVTFTGQISPKLGAYPRVLAVDSTGTVFRSTTLNNTGTVSTFSLVVTLRNTTAAQVLSFRMEYQNGPTDNKPSTSVAITKNTGGTLTSTLTVQPVQPGRPDLLSTSDSGAVSSDNYTNVASPTFNISQIVTGNTVELLRNGVVVASVNSAASSTVSITSPATPSGTYTYTARQSATAGGITGLVSQPLTVTIDTSAPGKPSAPDLTNSTDTGRNLKDNITSSTAPSFDISNIEAGAFVELLRGSTVVATQSNSPGGTIRLTVVGSTAGTANYTVRQTDLAGNVSTSSDATTVTIDNTAPAKPTAPDLQAASDTGVSSTDNQTRDTTPTFDIANIEAGANVELLRDGVVVASVISSLAGTVSITDPSASAGTMTYTARQTDAAGNVSLISSGLAVTFTTSGVPAPSMPDLLAASDSGLDNSDNITSATVLNFTVGGIGAGNTVDFLRNGVIIASLVSSTGGTVAFADRSLAPGAYTYTAVQTNSVGSSSSDSLSLLVTFDPDTPPPPGTPDLIATSDLGTSDFDNLTAETSPSFAIGNVEAGALVELLRDNVVVASLTSASAGTVILTDADLSAGTYSYTARQTDVAGNVISTTASLVVVIDTTTPGALAPPDLDAASDTGLNDFDNITSSTSPSFTIDSEDGSATVQLLRDGTVVASMVAGVTGSVTLVDPSVGSGVYNYTARQINAAGNIGSESSALQVTIDTLAPVVPSAPDLQQIQDTGSSDEDNITNSSTPVFIIGGIVTGNSVQLLRNGSVVNSIDSASGDPILLGDPFAPEGTWSYTVRQRSVAGLDSGVSAELSIQIDNTPPTTPAPPDLTSASDTGVSNTDNLTSSTVLDFDIVNVEVGATVELFRGDFSVINVSDVPGGTVTLNDPAAEEGDQVYTVLVTDLAGNVGPRSGGLTVTVNTSVPSAPVAPDLDAGSDAGRLSTDNITNVSSAQFSISGIEVGNSVYLLRDGVVVSSLDNAAGTTVALTDPSTPVGAAVYSAQQRSAAGLLGGESSGLSVTYEKTAPATPTQLDLRTTSDTGANTTDNVTMDPSPTFDISNIEAGASVQLLRNGTVVATLQPATAGLNSITDPSAPAGNYNYSVRQIDLAGNTSPASDILNVTIQANPANHLPVAVPDNYNTQVNVPLTVTGSGVLSNDTDQDGDTLTALFGGTGTGGGGGGGSGPGPFHGEVVLHTDGSFTYSPDLNYVGTDTFKYHANDEYGNSNVVTVTINVIDPNADDHGNSAATATFVDLPAVPGGSVETAGNLEMGGDVDWFKFTQVTGTTYTFTTILGSGTGGLPDSVIKLYDNDGTTELRSDDDSGPGNGSMITYTATRNGSLYLKVQGFNATNAGTYTLVAAVPPPAVAPVIRTSGGTSTSLQGKVVLIDSGATVTDSDSPNFNGGSLVVRITSGAGPGDAIKVRKQGTGTGQVNAAGTKLRLGKIVIGTLSGGSKGAPLTVTLNSGATPSVMQAVIRNLTFNSKKKGLTATPRVISITLTDDTRQQSQPALKTVGVSL